METLKMSIKEATRLGVMHQIDKKILTLRQASDQLRLSQRHVKRIRKRYLSEGEKGLISKHRGRTSPNTTDPAEKENILKILQSEMYEGFGPTFARDKIEERLGLSFSSETFRQWMIQAELWKPKKKKKQKVHQRRQRRPRFGDLLQGDGSIHDWFEGRGSKCTMVLFVDDATTQITAGRFAHAETTESYQQILKEHLDHYGRPKALYVDKHSIFKTTREASGYKEGRTHFATVLKELDIELICAHSPQAKGRVERANGVLQDRLIKEMRLRGISSIEEANLYLPEFIKDHNKRYGKEPADKKDGNREFDKETDLERLFAKKSQRKISKELSFSYEGVVYQIDTKSPNRFRKSHVTILDRPGKPIRIEADEKEYAYKKWGKEFNEKPKVLDSKELEVHWPTRKKPTKNHPWR